MSLIRQMWMLLVAVLLVALLGSVALSTASLRELLQTQLQLKNSDNAQSLALALSQQQGDPALMELAISAQFDTGHYQRVLLRKPDGSVQLERSAPGKASQAPAWFVALAPITAAAGVAQVSNGWNAIGTVEVLSHSSYVHDELWRSSLRTALLLAALAAVAVVLALAVLRRIRRPLDLAVAQAQSVVDGQFATVAEPSVPELRRLAQAMNAMVLRVKSLFEGQAEQLDVLRRQAHCDSLTGLSHRSHFMAELESALARDEGPVAAGLVLLRVRELGQLNERLGHKPVDQALLAIAHAIGAYPERVPGCLVGRLNGSDFALWLPAAGVAQDCAQALAEGLKASLPAFGNGIQVALGAAELPRARGSSAWFAAADAALARAEAQSGFAVESSTEHLPESMLQGERAWRQQIADALQGRRARLQEFPVLDRHGALLHLECPLQLQLDPTAGFEPAARWLPLATRSRLTADVDLLAVSLALEAIARDGMLRCVNLAPASLQDGSFIARLRELVLQAPSAARKLGVELGESAAVQQFELLQELGRQLRPLGVKLGLEHCGAGLTQVERLYQAGLDFVKLDISVLAGVSDDAARAAFVRGMVIMLRSLVLKVYGEGLQQAMDVQALWDCELDGVTGPWATAQARESRESP
ncbi:LapD/MoxY N-terminal periplasmic domain-containing protein [Pelomonas sp. SE-A7]|uniref:bifunctional diguanylate cyclase/phosphodiesterase n=1 Tax=Pelomonas sp. SE-A7 TaxID=3054953 RepID=UPI00259C94BE|nr:LapD/MoxY N-terminal periplasmic domain-containing protein [Pelomonas sp. SE-A7]MDM4766096.1 LapD/MoxY N-terminal periplasmic domain-containing protein [Pelomonas sp. SE-A7]